MRLRYLFKCVNSYGYLFFSSHTDTVSRLQHHIKTVMDGRYAHATERFQYISLRSAFSETLALKKVIEQQMPHQHQQGVSHKRRSKNFIMTTSNTSAKLLTTIIAKNFNNSTNIKPTTSNNNNSMEPRGRSRV